LVWLVGFFDLQIDGLDAGLIVYSADTEAQLFAGIHFPQRDVWCGIAGDMDNLIVLDIVLEQRGCVDIEEGRSPDIEVVAPVALKRNAIRS